MKPLQTNQQLLEWIAILPSKDSRKNLLSLPFSFTVVSLILCALSASIGFFIKFVSSDLEQTLYALYQIVSNLSMVNIIVVGIFSRDKIQALFHHLQDIYVKYKNGELFVFLVEADANIERAWSIFYKFFAVVVVSMPTMAIGSIAITWYNHGQFDTKYLYLPYKYTLPWNQETPLGYFGEVIFSIAMSAAYLVCNSAFLMLLVAICYHHYAFYRMFEHSLKELDISDRDHKQFLADIVQFHYSVKGIFMETIDLFSPVIMVQLICTMVYLAITVFQLDLIHEQMDINVLLLLGVGLMGTSNLFVCCYFGKQATDDFLRMADCLYDSNWHGLPVSLQKYFTLLIAIAQQPLCYTGFGISVLNLETFTKTLKAVYTYYMLFKTITE